MRKITDRVEDYIYTKLEYKLVNFIFIKFDKLFLQRIIIYFS